MQRQVEQAGLAADIYLDSAGTGTWHVGHAPDVRARRAASQRGYDLSALRGRKLEAEDFERFDLLIGMDYENLADLRRYCPIPLRHKVRLLMDYATTRREKIVADPYSGGADGFERVLDQCEDACAGLLQALRSMLAERLTGGMAPGQPPA